MEVNFNRKYSLIISRPPATLRKFTPMVFEGVTSLFAAPLSLDKELDKEITLDHVEDYVTIDKRESLEITELNIKAKIGHKKTSSSSGAATKSSIIVINPNTTTQEFIKAGDLILLRAGYKSNSELPLIYTGQVENSTISKSGVDNLMEITIGDKSNVSTGVVIKRTYASKVTSYRDILNDLVKLHKYYGISLGGITPSSILDAVITSGVSIEGSLTELLQKTCKTIGYRSYIHLNKLYLEPTRENQLDADRAILSYREEDVILLSEDLIKRGIKPTKDNVGDRSNSSLSISVSTFLFGSIDLSKKLRIPSGRYKGDYSIENIYHELDYRGNKWDTLVDCVSVGAE